MRHRINNVLFCWQFPGMPGGPEGALGMGPDGMPPVMNGKSKNEFVLVRF